MNREKGENKRKKKFKSKMRGSTVLVLNGWLAVSFNLSVILNNQSKALGGLREHRDDYSESN